MLNRVELIGNIGQDPEIRTMSSGDKVCNLSLATTEKWKNRDTGERQEKTEWHRITIWSQGLVNIVEQYVKKGSRLYIAGQIETRKWQDQEGNDRYSTEIVLRNFDAKMIMLSPASDGGSAQSAPPATADPAPVDEPEDEIPF